MDVEARRNLQALDAIAHDDRVTQRSLADQLGMALGLTNLYLKRLVRKGYVKCVNIQSNRLRYLLTPKGIDEKAKVTLRFLKSKLAEYESIKAELEELKKDATRSRGTVGRHNAARRE